MPEQQADPVAALRTDADADWAAVEAFAVDDAQAIVSNTADRGYELDPSDRPEHRVPRSFPAKLVKLLR